MKLMRVGLIGAGYIASWHAEALRATQGVRLAAVCDVSADAAQGLAAAYGVPAYTSLADLIATGICDSVHILTPPDLHHDLALQALAAGLHVYVEKPVALSQDEAARMATTAETAGKQLGSGHNFLGLPAYERLKRLLRSGDLGRVSSAEILWALPLAPLRSGPFGLWMLREPGNLLRELAPHPLAFVVDLFGAASVQGVYLAHPVTLPGGFTRHQTWRIVLDAGRVAVTVILSTVEVSDDRSVTLRGSCGVARLDYAADTLVVDHENAADLVVNPALRQFSLAAQHLREGMVNVFRQTLSFNRKSAYGLSFQGAFAGFYAGIATGRPDPRFAPAAAVAVSGLIDAVLARLPASGAETFVPAAAARSDIRAPKPTVMVIGGTGFIGSHLTRALVAAGEDVRVVSRGRHGPFADLPDQVEMRAISLKDRAALVSAMSGIDTVYHLGKALESTWEACLENDVGVTETIAEAALEAGVRRLVYTGTIASYDMSDPGCRITEATGFAADMTDRNLYARSKAECEARLLALWRGRGLPLVVARPGIVLGTGGPLQHWGIGRWHGAGAVRIWGDGRNTLPFVLIDDVVAGLMLMRDQPGIEGQSFNLVGDPMWTARDYFEAIHAATGARIRVRPGFLTLFWMADAVKYLLKRHLLHRHGVLRPSLRDWKSRAHLSRLANDQAKAVLGWTPEADRAAFTRRAVGDVTLFGF